MANFIGHNRLSFPAQSEGASGPIVETSFFDDGSTTVSITPGSDGAAPPGMAMSGAGVTVNPVPAAPAAPEVAQQA
jgi:hypothetical protein